MNENIYYVFDNKAFDMYCISLPCKYCSQADIIMQTCMDAEDSFNQPKLSNAWINLWKKLYTISP